MLQVRAVHISPYASGKGCSHLSIMHTCCSQLLLIVFPLRQASVFVSGQAISQCFVYELMPFAHHGIVFTGVMYTGGVLLLFVFRCPCAGDRTSKSTD